MRYRIAFKWHHLPVSLRHCIYQNETTSVNLFQPILFAAFLKSQLILIRSNEWPINGTVFRNN